MSEPATNVVPFQPREHIADPVTGEVLSTRDAQMRLEAQRDEIEALTKALGKAYALNTKLANERDELKEARAEEEAGENAQVIRELVRWHDKQIGRKTVKKKVPLGGVDAVIIGHLLRETDLTPRDIAFASVGFAYVAFHKDRWRSEKGLLSIHQMCMTRIDMPGKQFARKIIDPEKVERWAKTGRELRGEA